MGLQLRVPLEPLNTIVSDVRWISEGLMVPTDASLSDSCTTDRYTFSSLAVKLDCSKLATGEGSFHPDALLGKGDSAPRYV